MKKVTHLLRNTCILAVGNFGSKLLVFLLVPIYTSVLSAADYGSYDLILSAVNLLIPVLSLNIADAALRFSMDKDACLGRVARIGLSVIFASCIPVALAGLIFDFSWIQLPGLHYAGTLYVAVALYQFMIAFSRGLDRMTDIAIAGIMSSTIIFILTLFFLLELDMGLTGFFLSNIIGLVLPSAYLLFRQRKTIFSREPRGKSSSLLLRMVKYSFPLALTVVGWWLINTSGRFIVSLMCGLGENGLFSVAYKIPAILTTMVGIFVQAWQVSVVKEFDENDEDDFFGRTYFAVEIVLMVCCSLIILCSTTIASVLYEGEFYSAWKFAPLLTVAAVANSMAGLFGPFFSAKMVTRPMVGSTFLSGLVCVFLGIALAFLVGTWGVAFASVIACVANWLYRGKSVRKIVATDFKIRRTAFVFCLLVLQSFVKMWCTVSCVALIIQVGVVIVILLIYRNEVTMLLQGLARIVRNREV